MDKRTERKYSSPSYTLCVILSFFFISYHMNTITINGTEYPCRQTMGAFLRYKRETGKEATEIKGELSEVLTFLYCCIKSACSAESKEFKYTLTEFADSVTMDDIDRWTAAMNAEAEARTTGDKNTPDGEKKSPSL